MGVDGFWPIVSSKGKRVTLDILSDKIIAVDASIWIYQFAHALRDSTGIQIRAAHIVGFFKRICKLLFLRIKPVFVFDGPAIPLKFAALRKRHDDTVPDSAFRRAAKQMLLQNIQLLKTSASSSTTISHPALGDNLPLLQPVSESDVDEVYILTDSSDEDSLSPSRRLRLTVPEEFRGFVAERRSLDCVLLPISPEKQSMSRAEARKATETDIDARIDEEALKDLPLHEQYRGLLQTRSALLSQGRRKALGLASQMGSTSAEIPNLDKLSADQIKAVVELARVTDLSKSVRMQMAREENKDEVYVRPTLNEVPATSREAGQDEAKKKRKRKTNDLFTFDAFSDTHSALSTARSVSRNDLLFANVAVVKSEEKKVDQVCEEKYDTLSSDEDFSDSQDKLKLSLFGSDWADLIKSEPTAINEPIRIASAPMESHIVIERLCVPDKLPEADVEPSPLESKSDMDHTPEIQALPRAVGEVVTEQRNEISEESVVGTESNVLSEDSSSELSIASESEAESLDSVKPNVESTVVHEALPDPSLGKPSLLFDTVSDEELLNVFQELDDVLPRLTSDLEQDAFDLKARERINYQDSTDDRDAYGEIQELLTAFGIPWVSAPADAEAQCAFLCQAGLVDGVISDDSDALIYGSPIVFRHLYIGESTVEIFKLNSIGFNREELVSLALLLGCDFTVGVRGIGPVNATEIVRHFSGIDALRRFRVWAERFAHDANGRESDPVEGDDLNDTQLREFKLKHANYRSQWWFPDDFPSQEVWDVFMLPIVLDDREPFTWAQPDELGIVDVVDARTDMTRDQIESIIQSTLNQYRTAQIQRRITDYFSPDFERGTVAEVVSKRLKTALDRSLVKP